MRHFLLIWEMQNLTESTWGPAVLVQLSKVVDTKPCKPSVTSLCHLFDFKRRFTSFGYNTRWTADCRINLGSGIKIVLQLFRVLHTDLKIDIALLPASNQPLGTSKASSDSSTTLFGKINCGVMGGDGNVQFTIYNWMQLAIGGETDWASFSSVVTDAFNSF